jgi:hypothetical protein
MATKKRLEVAVKGEHHKGDSSYRSGATTKGNG